MNYKIVLHTLGRVLLLEALLMLLPLSVALIYGEDPLPFIIAIADAASVGFLLAKLGTEKSGTLYAREGFAIVSFSWIGISLIGALPFALSGEIPSYIDAFFETVSGFTTTGASILTDVESLSRGMLFWRSFTHWIGGMGVLVFITAIADKTPDRSVNILRAEMPGHSVDKLMPKTGSTAKILYRIYIALTVLEAVFLLCGGMPVFDSIVHALGTAGTGGFGIKSDSIASYSNYLQWIITVFMLLFGVSFNVYYLALLGKWRGIAKQNELWVYLSLAVICTAIVTVNISSIYGNLSDCLRLAAFQVSSLLTTTGFATADFNAWPQLSKAVLFVLMFCGGCMGSTAGGLKISRITVLFSHIRNELRRALRPRNVSAIRLNGRYLDAEAANGVTAYFALYIAVICAVFILISFEPFGMETNLSAAVSCVNNIGPGFGLVGPASSFADYSAFSKLVLSAAMLMGRLEMYPLLLTFALRRAK